MSNTVPQIQFVDRATGSVLANVAPLPGTTAINTRVGELTWASDLAEELRKEVQPFA